jgi:hypothetical protein
MWQYRREEGWRSVPWLQRYFKILYVFFHRHLFGAEMSSDGREDTISVRTQAGKFERAVVT